MDMKETNGWLKSPIFLLQPRDWLLLLKTKLFRLGIMTATICIEMSVPLATRAVHTWRQSTTLWQAVVPWHRWTTLIDTIRWPPLSTGTFVVILCFQWRVDGTGIILIGLWGWTTSLFCGIQPSLLLGRSVPIA